MASERVDNVLYLYKGSDSKTTLIYRIIFFAFCLKTVVRDIFYYIRQNRLGLMFALLTEISLLLTLLTLSVGILYALKVKSHRPGSRLQRIYGALFTICISIETLVFIAYWTLMSWWHFPNYIAKCPSQLVCHYFNLMVHGFPTFVMWFMALVEPTEVRKRHGYYLMAYTFIYAACHIPYAMIYGPVY